MITKQKQTSYKSMLNLIFAFLHLHSFKSLLLLLTHISIVIVIIITIIILRLPRFNFSVISDTFLWLGTHLFKYLYRVTIFLQNQM